MKKLLFAAIAVLLMAAPVPAQDTSVVLEWDAVTVSDLAGYNLYRGTISGGPYIRIGTVEAGTETYTDNVVDGIWFYVATAFDNGGNESVYSNECTTTVDSPPPAPGLRCGQ